MAECIECGSPPHGPRAIRCSPCHADRDRQLQDVYQTKRGRKPITLACRICGGSLPSDRASVCRRAGCAERARAQYQGDRQRQPYEKCAGCANWAPDTSGCAEMGGWCQASFTRCRPWQDASLWRAKTEQPA